MAAKYTCVIILCLSLWAVLAVSDGDKSNTKSKYPQSYAPDPADRVYPCKNSTDVNGCVGSFLQQHSSCSTSNLNSSALEPFYIESCPVDVPFINSTGTWENVTVTGLSNSSLVSFFYNNKTKKAVLTTFFPYFAADGTLTLNLMITNKEPIPLPSNYILYYSNLTITTIFNNYEKISLHDSFSFVDMPTVPTNNHKGSHDNSTLEAAAKYPEVAYMLHILDTYRGVVNIEGFYYRSPIFANSFINYKLCSFLNIV